MSEPLFAKYDLDAVLENQISKARKEVDACKEDYLLNVSEAGFAKYLASNHEGQPIQLGEPFMLGERRDRVVKYGDLSKPGKKQVSVLSDYAWWTQLTLSGVTD